MPATTIVRTASMYSADDPLGQLLRPPSTETEAERSERLIREAQARRVSEDIDEELRVEKELKKKRKDDVKLLLLGQAESGKSTLLKQFQLMYNPESLEEERLSWRAVVFWNIARSIKRILEVLEAYGDVCDPLPSSQSPVTNGQASLHSSPASSYGESIESFGAASATSSSPVFRSPVSARPRTASQQQIATLRLRLSPLVSSETTLAHRLSEGVHLAGSGKDGVYARQGWQSRAIAAGKHFRARGKRHAPEPDSPTNAGEDALQDEMMANVAQILEASCDDIVALWEHPVVRASMARRRLKLDEWSEFFLINIRRLAMRAYIPSIDDILRARIQTMGVAEHIFTVSGPSKSMTWHIHDVSGARGQRHSWVPYFDDAHAIIFLAPVSAFDQYLEEDPKVNRIDDSLQLFTQICAHPLLKNCHLVLFLNKTDILRAKLATGLSVKKYITSFGDRTNDYETVALYFRAHFTQVHKKNNVHSKARALYPHMTNVVDTKATQSIIENVRDAIFRGYLHNAALV